MTINNNVTDGSNSENKDVVKAVNIALDKDLKPYIGTEIMLYTRQVEALAETFPSTLELIRSVVDTSTQELKNFEKEYCTIEKESEKYKVFTVSSEYINKFNKITNQHSKSVMAKKIVPRTFTVSLVSQFDAYLGRLLRTIFLKKPELLNASEKTITIGQLFDFGTIDSAKEYILEKEIESVLRQSHSEQFDWMERKFSIKLREGLDIWPVFIELTERRNLFVHTNGTISSQYISVCEKNGVDIKSKIKVGGTLGVSTDYFDKAYNCIFELGVKLGNVLWRKIFPEEMGGADANLNNICYDLLVDGKYKLACKILDFATNTLKKHHNEESRRMFIINRAQAYKWHNDNEAARAIISAEDWSASSIEFKLAKAVILDEYDKALNIIKNIGKSGTITKSDYRDWPLFQNLRIRDDFANLFHDIFGEPLLLVEAKKDQHLEIESEVKGPEDNEDDLITGGAG